VLEKNKDNVKLVFKNFPLSSHRYARSAAGAALAAGTKGKYWEFHDELFKNNKQLSDEKIKEIATGLGLDANEIMTKMKSREIQNIINRDVRDAINAGVRGTPAVYINGKKLKSRSIRSFQNQIDAELKKRVDPDRETGIKK
jgi:protein-disulfide isomerase